MKKVKNILKNIILLTMLTNCTNNQIESNQTISEEEEIVESVIPDGQIAYEGKVVASKMETKENGRRYLTVDDKPFLMLGSQLRTDFFLQLDRLEIPELDRYFKLAATLSLTCVQIPVCWADVEPTKDTYKKELVEAYMKFARKYDMKLEILWFGSYMCGYSVKNYVPAYVFDDKENYPRVGNTQTNGWIGDQGFLYPNTEKLVDRETKAIAKMMEFVYEYDRTHGGKKIVAGVQIENEPDMLTTSHHPDCSSGWIEATDSSEVIWQEMVKHLDKVGKAVKDSDYSCYTRVNMTTWSGDWVNLSEDLCATDGIDFVGLDPYQSRLSSIKEGLNQLSYIDGNYPHIAENGGEYINNPSMELLAFTLGAGYEVFEVITTPNEKLVDWALRGVYEVDFTKRPQTDPMIEANKIYRQGCYDLAIADLGDILGFNLIGNTVLETCKEEKDTNDGITVEFETNDSALGYFVKNEDHAIFAASREAKMKFSNIKKIKKVEKGYYTLTGLWKKQGSVEIKNNEINLEKGITYRMEFEM